MMLVHSVLPSVVLFDIFVNILTHNLAEPAYEADVAQLEYKLVAGEHGLIIRVKGFNHKLPVSVWGLKTSRLTSLSQSTMQRCAGGALPETCPDVHVSFVYDSCSIFEHA